MNEHRPLTESAVVKPSAAAAQVADDIGERPPKVTAPSSPTVGQRQPPKRQFRLRRWLPTIFLLVLAAILMYVGLRFWMDHQAFVREFDARIVADEVLVSSQVAGRLTEMAIQEGDKVTKGTLLARIDTRIAEAKMRTLRVALATAKAEAARVDAEIRMVDLRTRRRLDSEKSKLTAAKALYESLDHEFRFVTADYRRAQALSKNGVISRKSLDQTRTTYLKSQQARLRGKAQIATAEADLGAAEADRGRIDVLRGTHAIFEQKAAHAEAQIAQQQVDMENRRILSPLDGYVSRTFANPGEYVNPGQRIALIHNLDDIWIEARIKETEVGRVKLGQKVDILVDALPGQKFQGTVFRIGNATTGEFSLLPNPNPSGTFTKVTQRLPIRISIKQQEGQLKPGMMVEVSINADR